MSSVKSIGPFTSDRRRGCRPVRCSAVLGRRLRSVRSRGPSGPAAKRQERENSAPQIGRDPVSLGAITCGAVARAARREAARAGNDAALLLR